MERNVNALETLKVNALRPKLEALGEGIAGLGEDGLQLTMELLASDQVNVIKFTAAIMLLGESLEALGKKYPDLGLTTEDSPVTAVARKRKVNA